MELKHDLSGILPSSEEMDRQLEEQKMRREVAFQRLKDRSDSIRVVDFHVHTFPEKIAKAALPLIVAMFIALLIVTYIPAVSIGILGMA